MVCSKKAQFYSNFKNQLMEITEKTTIKEIFQYLFDLLADSDIAADFDNTNIEFVKNLHDGNWIYFAFFENGECVDIIRIYNFQSIENKSLKVQKITNIINTIKNDNP